MEYTLRKKRKWLLHDYIFIVPVLLMGLSAVLSIPLLCYAALFISILIALVNPLDIFPVLCVTALSSDFFAVAEGLGAVRVFSIAFSICVLIYRLKGERKIEEKWIAWIFYIWVIIAITTMINDKTIITNAVMRISLSLLVVFASTNVIINEDIFEELVQKVSISYLVISLLVIGSMFINPSILLGRASLSESLNANRTAMMCAQLGATLVIFGYITRRGVYKWICYCVALLNSIVIVMTGSRSGFIAIVLGVTLTLIIENYKSKKIFAKIIMIALISVPLYLLFQNMIGAVPELATRYTLKDIIESRGTHRLDAILAEIHYIIPQHFLFGVGFSREASFLYQHIGMYTSSHNIIFTMLTQIGFLGSFGVIGVVIKLMKLLLQHVKFSSYVLIPIVMILTGIGNGIGEVVYTERFFWCAIALGLMALKSYKERQTNIG